MFELSKDRAALINKIETRLASITTRKICIFTGRASSGLVSYLSWLKKGSTKKYVVIPNILCNSVPNSILKAGLRPLFVDINLNNFTISIESLTKTLEKFSEKIIAAVVPHLYGHTFDVDRIELLRKQYKLSVIEDAAQTFPLDGKSKVGSVGDATIMSFGHTKPLDVGGGGCLLLDETEAATYCRKELLHAPKYEGPIQSLASRYSTMYYQVRDLGVGNPSFFHFRKAFPDVFGEIYVHQIPEQASLEKLAKLVELRESIAEARRKKADIYRRVLTHPEIRHPTYDEYTVPWRYTITTPLENEAGIAPEIRKQKIDVSPWYSCLDDWFELDDVQKSINLDNSRLFAHQVLNFWVDESHTEDQIRKDASIINNIVQQRLPRH